MGEIQKLIVDKINNAIKENGYSIKDFSKILGVSETTMHKILKQKQSLKIETIETIAEKLEKPISYFFQFSEQDCTKYLEALQVLCSNLINILKNINNIPEDIQLEISNTVKLIKIIYERIDAE